MASAVHTAGVKEHCCLRAHRRDAALLLVRQVGVRLLQSGHNRPACRVLRLNGVDSADVH